MRLFIAEKPSAAKAIASELGITDKGDGFIVCGSDKITWCFGHLLELEEPDAYTSDSVPVSEKTGKKLWRIDELPIVPEKWKIIPKKEAKKQLNIIGKLIKEADEIVNAGDADREGQLLVDEVLEHFNNISPVLRFWVAAHDSTSLQRGLKEMKSNSEYDGLGKAALARSRADWLIGMNLSRAYTLSAGRSGTHSLVTVGRVQTPTLKLVVDRDREIESFQSKPFYSIKAAFMAQGKVFAADWKPSEEQEGLDEESRLTNSDVANSLVKQLSDKEAHVKSYQKKPQIKQHPKAYSLSDLTLEASNRYGLSAANVLKTCQSLYETHKLTSYPRTDCSYLPESQFDDARSVLDALIQVNPEYETLISKADVTLKSKTWNDKKVTAHFGIIPTMHEGTKGNLTDIETKVYDLIVKRYIAQFYPLHEYESTIIEITVASECFITKGKTITQNGWQDIYKEECQSKKEDEQILPCLKKDESLKCVKASRVDSKTKPPGRYTEGTLQRAMENIHKVITDKNHKKLLKDGDGIGTPATRASIIGELNNRKFLEATGKYVISSQLGRSIVDALPEQVKSAVLTAMFERILKTIEKDPDNFEGFMEKQTSFVIEQVNAANKGAITLKGIKATGTLSDQPCQCCQKMLIRRKAAKGHWWSCSAFPECKQTYKDLKGKPNYNQNKEKNNA